MPFRLTNAPVTFQAYINKVLSGLLDTIYIVYLNNIIIIHCLTSNLDPYQAHADYSLYTYREKTLLRKPRDLSPHLLGLAYKAPTSYLQCSTTLLFNLLGNHCCRNKPTDALVSQTLLYYCRVIRGRLLLAPLPSITISFTT